MLMLNTKSSIDCDETEFDKHSEEIEEVMEKLMKLENFDCIVLQKYIDPANKYKEMQVIDSNLWDIYELAEYADLKNGVDILLDDEGFLNLSVYGQGYKMGNKDYLVNSVFKIIPRDEEWNFLDISDFIIKGGPVKLSEKQLEKEKKSTIELLNHCKEKVDRNFTLLKGGKGKNLGGER